MATPWEAYPVKRDKRQLIHRRDLQAENAALDCLDRFMTSFNARDGAALENTFNFPTYRLVGNPPQMIVVDQKSFKNRFKLSGFAWNYLSNVAHWHHSSWDRRTIIWSTKDKVHFDCCFTRYGKNNAIIGVYESLYIVTKDQNGHWGIKLRSTSADSKTANKYKSQSKL